MSKITDSETSWLRDFCRKVTGNVYTDDNMKVVKNRVNGIIQRNRLSGFDHFLSWIDSSDARWAEFLSEITIHTTFWFREKPHYEMLENFLIENGDKFKTKTFNFLSAGCSTGPEAYSAAFILEKYRAMNPWFEYRVFGIDIDPVSINKALNGVYNASDLSSILPELQHYVTSTGTKQFQVKKEIRQKCFFKPANIKDPKLEKYKFDWIFCRNVLIYFSESDIQAITLKLCASLNPSGVLCLGHSEHFDHEALGMKHIKNSTYERASENSTVAEKPKRKSIMIVDDSLVVRKKLESLFGGYDIIEADCAETATDLLKDKKVDLVTLDLNMPGQSGDEWLIEARKNGFDAPVIIVSDASKSEADRTLDLLGMHAESFFAKPKLATKPYELNQLVDSLLLPQKSAAPLTSRNSQSKTTENKYQPDAILIGASTGGTQALSKLLENIPKPCPPIVVVQHITKEFATPFAERLAFDSGLEFSEIDGKAQLQNNTLYLSTGDYHIELEKNSQGLFVKKSNKSPVMSHRPAVDPMFFSAAKIQDVHFFAALLTGMGSDGAKGMKALYDEGHFTMAQDEKSSVVYGMPRVATELGAACKTGNLNVVREEIEKCLKARKKGKSNVEFKKTLLAG